MIKRTGKNRGKRKGFFILPGILIAIASGVVVGGFFPHRALVFAIFGKIFLNLLMMIVVPLVVCSIVVGITDLGDIRKMGGIGKKTIIYYFVTTSMAVLLGIVLVNIIKPGRGVTTGEKHDGSAYRLDAADNRTVHVLDGIPWKRTYDERYVLVLRDQKVRGTIASMKKDRIAVKYWEAVNGGNEYYIFGSAGERLPLEVDRGQLKMARHVLKTQGRGMEIRLPVEKRISAKAERSIFDTIKEVIVGDDRAGTEGMVPRNIFNAMQRMEILPLIFFSLILGAALSVLGDRGRAAVDIFQSLNDAIFKIVDWIMYIAPLGIFGIITERVGQAGGFRGFLPELSAMGKYAGTVTAGLLIHGFIFLPLVLYFFGRRNPLKYLSGVGAALLNAFSTASSSATLPLSMENVEKNNDISQKTAGFVLPLGATINMDGTALYEAVAAIFISQVYAIDLGLADQIIIFVTATLAAIGAAGIPEAGLVTMVIVLRAVGLPVEGIGLILAIDWFLDRCRTTINVWGDCVGAGVIDTLEDRGNDN